MQKSSEIELVGRRYGLDFALAELGRIERTLLGGVNETPKRWEREGYQDFGL